MSKLMNYCVLLVWINCLVDVSANATVADAFQASQIVPSVIPVAPTNFINVTFPSGVSANLGNELTPTQVKDLPTVTWNATSGQYYTLLMIDPDGTDALWQHWFVANIPGANLTDGETISTYVGAGPGSGSGYHRYIFLVYEQPSNTSFDEPRLNNTSTIGRSNFPLSNFTTKHNLGNPIAGNFFKAQYDDYVPTLYQQLGITNTTTTTTSNPNASSTNAPTVVNSDTSSSGTNSVGATNSTTNAPVKMKPSTNSSCQLKDALGLVAFLVLLCHNM